MPVYISLARLERAEMASTGLHFRALNMAHSYRFNYGLEFPSLNAIPLSIRYAQRLALPSKPLMPPSVKWFGVLTKSSRSHPYGENNAQGNR